jgi:archaemetzincin
MLRRRTTPPVLELVAAGRVDDALLPMLGAELQARTGLQWRVGEAVPLRDEWRDPRTGLVRSIHLMHALMDAAEEDEDGRRWTLAIAEEGFCAEGVGPILGEAAVDGCCATIGVAPLRRGSGADADVFRARMVTEALHELGHLAGAEHCGRASCVMYPSLDIADTDLKGDRFCVTCASVLEKRGIRKS